MIVSVRSVRYRPAAVLVAFGVAAAAALTPAAPARADLDLPVPLNYIFNNGRNGTGGIGVSHDNSDRLYDAVLPAYATTESEWHWDHASSFYIGPGYCADVFRMQHGHSTWVSYADGLRGGSGVEVPTDYNYDWQVQPYKQTNGQC